MRIRQYASWKIVLLGLAAICLVFGVVCCDKGADEKTSELSNEPPAKTMELRIDDETTIDAVYIQPGSFVMGRNVSLAEKALSKIGEVGMVGKYPDDWPERKVKITKGFYVGKYKVTTAQFCRFLNATANPQDNVA